MKDNKLSFLGYYEPRRFMSKSEPLSMVFIVALILLVISVIFFIPVLIFICGTLLAVFLIYFLIWLYNELK